VDKATEPYSVTTLDISDTRRFRVALDESSAEIGFGVHNDLVPPSLRELITKAIDKALEIQQPVVEAYVARLRRWRPDSPGLALQVADRQYLATVSTLGAAAGAGAAAPGVGLGVAAAVSAVEIGAYTEATALYVLAYATIHGIDIRDLERRKLLLYTILLGKSGADLLERLSGRTAPYWARILIGLIDPGQLRAINKVLGRNVLTKYGTQQGILVLGRAIPFWIGAGIGGAGNAGLGYLTVRSTRKAFGPPPTAWIPADSADPRAGEDPADRVT
jgi:hypothetical protein